MPQANVNDALNRLLMLLCRSFPRYLVHAPPFMRNGDRRAVEALQQIVADQEQMSQRVSRFILANEGRLEPGEFPMEFTDTHDLAVEYIIKLAINYQKQDIAAIEPIVEQLRLNPAASNLAEEALGLAKGHLESLQELAHQRT